MVTYYKSSGSSDIYSRPIASDFVPGNAMIYTNHAVSYPQTLPGDANNISASKQIQVLSSFGGGASQMLEIQDSGSWREDQEDNDRNCFPVNMRPTTRQGQSLGLSSQTESSRGNNNEYATQVVSGFTQTIHHSKYLKAAQELLDEVVSVKKTLNQFQPEGEKFNEEKENKLQESSMNHDIPQGERQKLQSKLTKLLYILDKVSNWFINARVRLWKPMVEEMYKEEFTDALQENGPNLSSTNTPETTEIQEQKMVSNSNNVVPTSNMGQNTVAHARDRLMMVTEMTRHGSGGMSLKLGIQNPNARGDVPMPGGINDFSVLKLRQPPAPAWPFTTVS